MHEDVDNDGVYEKHSRVFVDKLVFPRFAMPIGANAILAMESNTDEVWNNTDTNGDSVADKKELFTTSFGRAGNVEHQQSSLMWGMDNWMYSTYNAFRVRWTPAGILKEPTAANNSQWGITQDNFGKVWFQGGASGLLGISSCRSTTGCRSRLPAAAGAAASSSSSQDSRSRGAPLALETISLGPARFVPAWTLQRVTGAAGNDIVRAHRMPSDLQGDYLYGEPVARIVRRVRRSHRRA